MRILANVKGLLIEMALRIPCGRTEGTSLVPEFRLKQKKLIVFLHLRPVSVTDIMCRSQLDQFLIAVTKIKQHLFCPFSVEEIC